MHFRPIILLTALIWPGIAPALELALPGNPSPTGEVLRDPDSYNLPIGPYANGVIPVQEVEGRVLQKAWKIEAQGLTTLQMIRPIFDQLKTAGFEVLFECAGAECGGFDFRFNTKVMPAPNMYVDLFDFRFLSAQKDDSEFISIILSRAGAAGYIQVIHVTPEGEKVTDTPVLTPVDNAIQDPDQPFSQTLQTNGHIILSDLEFNTGSATLGAGPFATLETLAAFLLADKTRRVVLVGHTDTVGALENNIILSKRRATSVLERLVAEYDVSRAQLEAEGMGYLAPIAPNLTEAGREINRRVEAVLLNTE